MEAPDTARFGFDQFDLDLRNGELRKGGVRVNLQVQPFKVLALLVARAGQVVSRKEICERIWGGETFVDFEQGLNYCIRQIRVALGADSEGTGYIETLPRRGYRFRVPVVNLAPCAPPPGRTMLAVLPLENHSKDQEQDYLADGLTEEFITEMGRFPSERLGVIARNSAMQYKGTSKGVSQIGRELGVEYLVEGALHRSGNRVRVNARLIRVADQTHVWAHTYERQIEDVLLLQSEIAQAVAGEVHGKLVPEAARPAVERRVNPEAYEACLKARFLWNRRTRAELYRALEFFSRSIELDGDYAPAFAGLSDTYLVLLDYRHIAPKEALALATAAARNAIRLDPGLADAHTSLGHAKLHALDWDGAEQEFRTAIQLGPSYAPARYYYSNLLVGRKRFEEAIREGREAVKLDPVSMMAQANVALLYYGAGQYKEALEACRKALAMEPAVAPPHDDLGRILLAQGRCAEAVNAFEKAVELSDGSGRYLASLGYAYGVAGRSSAARDILAKLTVRSQQLYVASSDFALVNAGLADWDQAFYWLERAYNERDCHLPFLHVDPRLASLYSDPRFKAFVDRAGLV